MDDIKKALQGGDCTMLADMARNQREKARMLSDRLQEQGERRMRIEAEAAVMREALEAAIRADEEGRELSHDDVGLLIDAKQFDAGRALLERVERMEKALRRVRDIELPTGAEAGYRNAWMLTAEQMQEAASEALGQDGRRAELSD